MNCDLSIAEGGTTVQMDDPGWVHVRSSIEWDQEVVAEGSNT